MIYGCHLYNFGIIHWFDSREEANQYGSKSGFQYIVVEKHDER